MISRPSEFDHLRADLATLREMIRDQGENGKKLRDALESLQRENARLRSRLARVCSWGWMMRPPWRNPGVWSRRVPGGRRNER